MSKFPRIQHLNDLLPFIQDNKQIRVKPCEVTGHTVVCYMVQDEDTFAGTHEAYERECRGISFDENGKISARTLHKFFNIGERDATLPENIDWSQVVRVMEKRDGSMVTPVKIVGWKDKIAGRFKFKTKKSFETPEAALADEIARKDPGFVLWISNLLDAGLTPTFEVTSPRFPIVVRYEKDELTLLHIRENDTGRYLNENELKFLNPPCPMVENLIDNFRGGAIVDWGIFKHRAETEEGIEGWIVQLASGEMFKVKTKWYCELHHSVTFTRWRDIARTVCADQSDDLKGAFAMVGRSIEPILQVERHVMGKINAIQNAVELHAANGRGLGRTAKDMALAFKEHELFGLVMRAFREQEIDYMEYYVKHHLEEDWGLEVVA